MGSLKIKTVFDIWTILLDTFSTIQGLTLMYYLKKIFYIVFTKIQGFDKISLILMKKIFDLFCE